MTRINYQNITIKKANEQDVNDILSLQDEIFLGLDNKNWLRENSIETFVLCTKKPNLTLCLYDQNVLVGVGIIYALHDEEDLSKSLIKHQTINSANLKLILVKKEYRGNRFMQALMFVIERYAYQNGYTHLCSTVNGENIYSYHNLQQLGYEYDNTQIKYDGLERDIYVKDIRASQTRFINNCNSLNIINNEDCFKGDRDVAINYDVIEDNGEFGLLENDRVKFNDRNVDINDLDNPVIWIRAKDYE